MVKRYYPEYTDGPGAVMLDDSDGGYVEYDDYEELALQYDGLQKDYDKLVAAIGNLYRAC